MNKITAVCVALLLIPLFVIEQYVPVPVAIALGIGFAPLIGNLTVRAWINQ